MHSAALPLILTFAGMNHDTCRLWRFAPPTIENLRFRHGNQRQARKNRRRSHAAGARNAFA